MYTVYTYKCMVLANPTHVRVLCAWSVFCLRLQYAKPVFFFALVMCLTVFLFVRL